MMISLLWGLNRKGRGNIVIAEIILVSIGTFKNNSGIPLRINPKGVPPLRTLVSLTCLLYIYHLSSANKLFLCSSFIFTGANSLFTIVVSGMENQKILDYFDPSLLALITFFSKYRNYLHLNLLFANIIFSIYWFYHILRSRYRGDYIKSYIYCHTVCLI